MFLSIGLIIGLVLGLTGSGGSVFAVPLLVLLAGVPMHQAIGLSLAAVSASAIFGTLRLSASQTMLWIPALLIGATGMLSAPVGQWAASQLSATVLTVLFAVVAAIIAFTMWQKATRHPEYSSVTRASDFQADNPSGLLCRLSPSGQFQLKPRCMGGLLIGGLLVGLLSGLLGVGGGFVIVPLLLFISQVTMQQAVSTSLIVISVISAAAFVSYLMINQPTAMPLTILAWLFAGGIGGMMIGQVLTRKIANPVLQKGFAIALALMAITLLGFHFLVELKI